MPDTLLKEPSGWKYFYRSQLVLRATMEADQHGQGESGRV